MYHFDREVVFSIVLLIERKNGVGQVTSRKTHAYKYVRQQVFYSNPNSNQDWLVTMYLAM